jgi:hypothetical protein
MTMGIDKDDRDYDAGVTAGELAGAAALYYGGGTLRYYDSDWTPFKAGFSDGWVAGYWQQVRVVSKTTATTGADDQDAEHVRFVKGDLALYSGVTTDAIVVVDAVLDDGDKYAVRFVSQNAVFPVDASELRAC